MLPLFSNVDYNCMLISSSVDNQSVIPSLTSLPSISMSWCVEKGPQITHTKMKKAIPFAVPYHVHINVLSHARAAALGSTLYIIFQRFSSAVAETLVMHRG